MVVLTLAEPEAKLFHLGTDVAAALGALTECSSQLAHEPLKGTVGRAIVAVLGQVESSCREVVGFLLRDLASREDTDDVTIDKLWTLRSLAKRSEVARRWICETGGIGMVAQAMWVHSAHNSAQKEGVWLCYTLGGLDGILELLQISRGHASCEAAAAWAIYDVASKRDLADWPRTDALVTLLLEVLRAASVPPPPVSFDKHWACCSALRALIVRQPCFGSLFVERGGGDVLLATLRLAKAAGNVGSDAFYAAVRLTNALTEGNAAVSKLLRERDAMDVLVDACLHVRGKVAEEAMWSLGHIGGILVVLHVMSRLGDSPEALQSGLLVLSKLSWQCSTSLEDGFQQQLPQAAEALASLARQVAASERPARDMVMAIQALGGVMHVLSPHIPPGTWSVADDTIGILVSAVGPSSHALVAQAAAASLGHVAVSSPKWRGPLRGALPDLQRRMRTPTDREDDTRHQKCLYWACAAIAGLPAMIEEMRCQPNSAIVQESAITAVIDILEGHMDGETDEGGVELHHVNEALLLVASAIRIHRTHVPVQRCASYALGQLCGLLPSRQEFPMEAIDGVLAALGRHHNDYKVARSVCAALRAFLSPRRDREGAGAATVAHIAAALRARDVSVLLRRIISDYPATTDKVLAEDTWYTLGIVEGPQVVARSLMDTTPQQVVMRCGGLKALVELARACPELFRAPLLQEVRALTAQLAASATGGRCEGVVDGSLTEDEVELLRHTEMLHGLLFVAASTV